MAGVFRWVERRSVVGRKPPERAPPAYRPYHHKPLIPPPRRNPMSATLANPATSPITAAEMLAAGMTQTDVLQAVAQKHTTPEEAAKFFAAKQPQSPTAALRFKVSEKGGVSVYGLQSRWPVTLYASQWERLFAQLDDLKQFLADNAKSLSRKDD
jgi:hypothetical protein